MLMIIAVHQPAYLPWLGYFDKLMRSDIFVFLDSVQYEKNSFINRNKIKTQQGELLLSIPIKTKGHTSETLKVTKIDNGPKWQKKHLSSICMNYRKAPRFEECYPKIEKLYQNRYDYLSELCLDHMLFWLKELRIMKKIVRSSELPINSKKSDLVLDLCKYFDADYYISGTLGKNYLNNDLFQESGIYIEYQKYQHPIYQQLYGGFIPNLGVIDFWMNTDQVELITQGNKLCHKT